MADLGSAFMAPLLQNQQLLSAQQQYENNKKLMPLELAQKAASTRYTADLAKHLETEDAASQRMAQLMQQAATGGGNPMSASGKLFQLSDLAAKSGSPTLAATYLEKGSQAAAHEATASKAEVDKLVKQATLINGGVEFVTKRLDSVKSEEDWNRVNQEFESTFKQRSPFADVPYDPKVVDSLKSAGITAYQKQLADLREKALANQVRNVDSEIRHRGAMEGIAGAHLSISKQREARLAKGGGKDIGDPSKLETEAAGRLLGDSLEGDDKDSAAFSIASNAKALRRKNPGMSADDAIRSAYGEAVKRGDVAPGEAPKKLFGVIPLGKQGPGKFVPAQPLPKSGDAAHLVVGQHYRFPKGGVYEWSGKDWKKVGEGKAAATAPAADSSDDEDDNGDDAE